MIRHCDGTDPNLRMRVFVDPVTGEKSTKTDAISVERPCDCGGTFDDINHMTYYPHTQF